MLHVLLARFPRNIAHLVQQALKNTRVKGKESKLASARYKN
jgi:hypothetical protein